jgi:hypothetical protein
LYLGDNDFEFLPPEVGQLKNLQIVSNFSYCVIVSSRHLTYSVWCNFFNVSFIQVKSDVVIVMVAVVVTVLVVVVVAVVEN